MFKYLPWFTYTVVDPMQANGFTFQTDKFICNVDAPIVILHAKDDHVVPYKLGYKVNCSNSINDFLLCLQIFY